MTKAGIFVSYSHRDRDYLGTGELMGFLRGLERDGDVHFWADDHLSAGDRWNEEIRDQLGKAQIALVLVSQAFLDSRYCMDVEVSKFLERRGREGLRIFPVVLSACEWERHSWLAEHQALPGGDETIEEHYADPGRRKRLYLRIRKELRGLVEEILRADVEEREEAGGAETLSERHRVTLVDCALSIDAGEERLDPEDSLELLQEAMPRFRERCVAQVQAFEGHVVSLNNSGRCLICFGYPLVHEDESLRAVRAGLGIVDGVQGLSEEFEAETGFRLAVRLGIQTGLVINPTGSVAAGELQDSDAHAIAQLLLDHAPPNSVVIGEATYKLVRSFFATQREIQFDSPGLRRQILGWRVVEDLGVRSRFEAQRLQGLTPMVGRETERNLLLDAWQRAAEGSGRMVVISAEAGIGKSRLLEEIKRATLPQPHYLVQCQCSALHRNSALYPIIQAVQSWLKLALDDTPEMKLKKLEEVIDRTMLERDQIVPFLADLLSLPAAGPHLEGLSAKQHKDRIFEAILLVLFQRALQTPVLFVVEDLHWMDPSTEELLGVLLDELPEVAMMVVCTARPEYHPPPGWTDRDYFLPIKLGQLSRPQVGQMILQLTGGKELPPDLLKAIFDKTEGYPLFVEDLTRMVIESDILAERQGVYTLSRPLQSLAIPDTLQEALMVRLNRVEGARLVAQLGAVIGREFTYEMIQAIYPLSEDALKESLGKLVASGLLYRRGLMSRANYLFKHALVQDAIYHSLLRRERKRYHGMIARLIESRFPALQQTQPEMLAHHYYEAGMVEPAIRCWLAAGETATGNGANLEAISHANSALQALPGVADPEQRARLELSVQTMQGPALLAVRGWAAPELGAAFERARELSVGRSTPEQLFRITRGLWSYYMVAARLSDSVRLAAELMRAAEEAGSEDYRLEAHAAFCDSYFWLGQPAQVAEHAERGLAVYRLESHHQLHSLTYGEDPSVIFLCYGGLSNWLLGRTEQAEAIVRRAMATVDSYTHLFSRGFLLNGLAWYFVHTGDPVQAWSYGEALRKLATENDFPPWRALSRTQCGWAIAAQGATDAGVAEIRIGMSEWKAAGSLVSIALDYALIADAYLRGGRYGEAMCAVDDGLAHLQATEERHYWPELLRLKAELLEHLGGERSEIEAHYLRAIAIAQEQRAVALETRAAAGLSRLAMTARQG